MDRSNHLLHRLDAVQHRRKRLRRCRDIDVGVWFRDHDILSRGWSKQQRRVLVMDTKVINLLGAPGAGKSVLAVDLFSLMKKKYASVELVTEYAKELHYEGLRSENLDPLDVFAEQHRRVNRLIGNVEFVITDSPLYLSAFYATKISYPKEFGDYVVALSKRFNNVNIMLQRNHRYDPRGRSQGEEESNAIHHELIEFLTKHSISFEGALAGDHLAPVIAANLLNDK